MTMWALLLALLSPDTVYLNAIVVTMDAAATATEAQAVAVDDGKIVAVGDNATIEAMAGPETKRVRSRRGGAPPRLLRRARPLSRLGPGGTFQRRLEQPSDRWHRDDGRARRGPRCESCGDAKKRVGPGTRLRRYINKGEAPSDTRRSRPSLDGPSNLHHAYLGPPWGPPTAWRSRWRASPVTRQSPLAA